MADIGTLNPEQMLQQQQILRQQKMAEMLMQQGMQQPQGQMISGRYVAPSIFQNLAGLANTYVGQRGIEKAEQAQLDLAKQLREQGVQETQRLMNTFGGKSAVPEQVTEMAGPYMGNIPKPTATIAGTPAITANPKLAYAEALNMQSPQARALLPFLATEAFKKPKWEKAEYTDEKTGKTRQGVIDVNSPDPISTFQVGGTKPEMTAAERIGLNMRGAELSDKGIGGFSGYGGSQPIGAPMGQPQVQPVGQSKANPYAPSSLPMYEPDPSLSPAQNRELAAEFSKANKKLAENAKNSFDILKEVAGTLRTGNPSSGRGENIITGAREFFGGGGETSKADAILTIYGTKLTQQVPRFEGPQSDRDTALYQASAGDVGNPNKPIATRMAAVQTMIDLNKKYYPKGDWATIDTTMPSSGKVSLAPSAPTYAVNPQTGERIMSTDNGKNWKPAR
jgi:hypothetical protein